MADSNGFEFWRDVLKSAKYIVAPMVDQSELAWRMLSRKYGAELCYTPMLHATVFARDAIYRRESLASCQEDRPLIVQFCGNDPETILKACKLAEDHCDGIDLNLGCPQGIAKRGHYGAFLQEEWTLLENIVSLCSRELKVPFTAKIRIFPDIDKTVKYAKMLEKAGCQILTVHGRTKEQKGPQTGLARWSHIKAVKEALSIPVFANGNIQYLSDVERCLKETGVDGVMSAEGNLHNPALFAGLQPLVWDIAMEYLDFVEKYPCPMSYVRGHLFKIFQHALSVHQELRPKLANAKNVAACREIAQELKNASQEDVSKGSRKLDLPHPYWVCQPYVRPKPEVSADPTREKAKVRDKELEQIKRSLSPSLEQKLSKNKLKKLKKNPNKKFVDSGEKFPPCECGNPKGLKCTFSCCKSCCRVKAVKQGQPCAGHKTKIKVLQSAETNGQGEIGLRVSRSENNVDCAMDVDNGKPNYGKSEPLKSVGESEGSEGKFNCDISEVWDLNAVESSSMKESVDIETP